MMPRPEVRWPELPALFGHDAEIAAAGITTVFDALGVGDADPEADARPGHGARARRDRPRGGAGPAARRAPAAHAAASCRRRTRASCSSRSPAIRASALISLMDHTPGQRQWDEHRAGAHLLLRQEGLVGREVRALGGRVEGPAGAQRRRPTGATSSTTARARGIPLASHDDTTPEHVEQAHGEGVAISEFPTSVEAAQAARAKGMAIVMGAPNVVRGGSHSGNVAAVELARRGLLDVLSSDYVPASLLMAAFRLTSDAGFSVRAGACHREPESGARRGPDRPRRDRARPARRPGAGAPGRRPAGRARGLARRPPGRLGAEEDVHAIAAAERPVSSAPATRRAASWPNRS